MNNSTCVHGEIQPIACVNVNIGPFPSVDKKLRWQAVSLASSQGPYAKIHFDPKSGVISFAHTGRWWRYVE